MHRWLLPLAYMLAGIVAAVAIPRIENAYGLTLNLGISASASLSALSAIASGTMALTAIVFSIAFVMVQFSAVTYSPRIALGFANDPLLFHAMGMFAATFTYALAAMAWVDRDASGSVPEISWVVSASLVIASLLVFARLVQRLSDLQITNTLRMIGDHGREVIRDTFAHPDRPGPTRRAGAPAPGALGPVTVTLRHDGPPRTIQRIDMAGIVALARGAGATIVLASGIGDTLADGATILRVHGGSAPVDEAALRRGVSLGRERTYAQDPKYPIRLLVDIAIKALSPAINDPTTAVQAVDQIEDLLRRLARAELDAGNIADEGGTLRLVVPMPDWDDYLSLALDEIRMFGIGSLQVLRRLRAVLLGLADLLGDDPRAASVGRYLRHLDAMIEHSPLAPEDKASARQEDAQGLGLTRDMRGAA